MNEWQPFEDKLLHDCVAATETNTEAMRLHEMHMTHWRSAAAIRHRIHFLGIAKKRQDAWRQYEKDILTEEWRKGTSASRIARMLPGRSRNAVIGQARRMRLKARPSPIKRFPRRSWLRYVPHLFNGRQDTCEHPDGCEEKAVKGSYCERHHALCYTGKPKRTGKPFTFTHKGNWA